MKRTKQVPFINREKEIDRIDRLIGEGSTAVMCIQADGGIGKTRLLQEIRRRYAQPDGTESPLLVTEIIDFDDRSLYAPQHLGRRIAGQLGERFFEPYLQGLADYRKMEIGGVSMERLIHENKQVSQTFVDCFNGMAEQHRAVILMDTIDALEGSALWNYLLELSGKIRNSLIVISGRNAEVLAEALKPILKDQVHPLKLDPLEVKASQSYLAKKQELLNVVLEPDLAQKILLLAQGRPILIDLAVEWRARNIPLNWLVASDLDELRSLSEPERRSRQKEFEYQLVSQISQTRHLMDWLSLLLAHIYPLDEEMIANLLNIGSDEAKQLFEDARTYVFIKSLPDGRITLHDEMRRMIKEYVWREVDPEEDHRKTFSERAIRYLEQKGEQLNRQIEQLETKTSTTSGQPKVQAELSHYVEREALERELWAVKEQLLRQCLFFDLESGMHTFVEMFDAASRFSLREALLDISQQTEIQEKLTADQKYEVDRRKGQVLLDMGSYQDARDLAAAVLARPESSPLQKAEMLILRGNAEIRLGSVERGIEDFSESVSVCQEAQLWGQMVRAKNALGWAHRLRGELELAKRYYEEAQELTRDYPSDPRDRGWILNNLTFVYSDSERSRAIDLGKHVVEYWKSIGYPVGLGAAYLVMGIVYYRSDLYSLSADSFQEALRIFEPLNLQDWMGQVYSWRGALYQDMSDLDRAQSDLELSLKIAPRNIEAMSLNRLGRVHMARKNWDLAEQYMLRSLEIAPKIPDYVYWLGSLARLISIAAEKGEDDRLDEFYSELRTLLKVIRKPDKNSLGMAYIALGRLALRQERVDEAKRFLKNGISLVTEYGSYARTDVRSRLKHLERDFDRLNPEIIREVGGELYRFSREKERNNSSYIVVTDMVHKWANWKGEAEH